VIGFRKRSMWPLVGVILLASVALPLFIAHLASINAHARSLAAQTDAPAASLSAEVRKVNEK